MRYKRKRSSPIHFARHLRGQISTRTGQVCFMLVGFVVKNDRRVTGRQSISSILCVVIKFYRPSTVVSLLATSHVPIHKLFIADTTARCSADGDTCLRHIPTSCCPLRVEGAGMKFYENKLRSVTLIPIRSSIF